MLQAYSENVAVAANAPVAFNNQAVRKGTTVVMAGPGTIELNRMGVYMVSVDGVAGTETTIQLYRDGVAMPQAQSTGTVVGFETLVQANANNNQCCCSSPVKLQIMNTTAATFDNVNIVVTKLC